MDAGTGSVLSHYRLVERIGEGGMGVVWKAHDEILDRIVAIKLLPVEVAQDEQRRQSFLHEARLASSVSDARIAQVFELGRHQDLDFIVMEFVDGRPLSELLHGRALPPDKVVALGEQVARALSRAHHKGLVHRDIKPANLLVTDPGEIKIVDFGLAALFRPAESAGGSDRPTQAVEPERADRIENDRSAKSRRFLGTLPYMSPEQIRGEPDDVRSDVFSLGVVLYEMATGRLPFAADRTADLAAEILDARPVPPRKLRPQLPLELGRIIEKAMARQLEERYQTMEELAVDIKRLRRELERGSPPSYQDLTRNASWGRRTLLAVVVVGLFALAGLGAWQIVSRMTGAPEPAVLVVPFEVRGNREGADYAGRSFAESLAVNLAQVETLRVLPVPNDVTPDGSSVDEAMNLARDGGASLLLMGTLIRDGPAVRATVRLLDPTANRLLWGADESDGDGNLSRLASALARATALRSGSHYPELYESFDNLVGSSEMAASPLTAITLGAVRQENATKMLQAGRELVELFPNETDAHALLVYALFRAWLEDPSEVNRLDLESGLLVLDRTDPNNPYSSHVRALTEHESGAHARALVRYTTLLERTDLSPALRTRILSGRAETRSELGDYESAFSDLEHGLTLNPTDSGTLSVASSALRRMGRFEEAEVRARQAVALAPSNWRTQQGLGLALNRLERHAEAAVHHELACNLSQSQEACALLALSLLQANRKSESAEAAERARELTPSRFGTYNLGCYWALRGRSARAISHLWRSVELGLMGEFLHTDTDLDSLRGHPEFKELVAEVDRRIAEARKAGGPP